MLLTDPSDPLFLSKKCRRIHPNQKTEQQMLTEAMKIYLFCPAAVSPCFLKSRDLQSSAPSLMFLVPSEHLSAREIIEQLVITQLQVIRNTKRVPGCVCWYRSLPALGHAGHVDHPRAGNRGRSLKLRQDPTQHSW